MPLSIVDIMNFTNYFSVLSLFIVFWNNRVTNYILYLPFYHYCKTEVS